MRRFHSQKQYQLRSSASGVLKNENCKNTPGDYALAKNREAIPEGPNGKEDSEDNEDSFTGLHAQNHPNCSDNHETILLDELVWESIVHVPEAVGKEASPSVLDIETSNNPMTLQSHVSRKGKSSVPPNRRGKDDHCWWCKQAFHLTGFPCWNDALMESLCQKCSMLLNNQERLPIFKAHVMNLDIRCGCCSSLYGSYWTWSRGSHKPACGEECSYLLQHSSVFNFPDRRFEPQGVGQVRYQDQCEEKFRMHANVVAYFCDEHGIDTSITALVSMKRGRLH